MEGLRIGELASAAAVPVQTVRYYERRGLILSPPRSPSGYRMYPPESVTRICFIRRAKELGFSLSEIEELLELRVAPGSNCEAIRERAQRTLDRIEARVSDLRRMQRTLETVIESCEDKQPTAECPIVEALES